MQQPDGAETDTALDQHARAVGLVAIRAARVEHLAGVLTVILIGTPRAAAVVLGSGWSPIKQAISPLLAELIEYATDDADRRHVELPLYRRIEAVIKRADRLMAQRGNVVHALWDSSTNPDGHIAMTIKRWGRETRHEWSLDDLHTLQSELLQIDHELMVLCDQAANLQ